MRKLTIIFLFLAVNVWFALGWTPPSPITPPNTVPDAVANMNMGIIGGSVPAGEASPYEDFTTYTETDANGRFTVATNTITVGALCNNDTEHYVYKAHAEAGDFHHQVDVALTQSGASAYVVLWAVTNGADFDWNDVTGTAENDGLAVAYRDFGGTLRFYIYSYDNGGTTDNDLWIGPTSGTEYFLDITMDDDAGGNGQLTVVVYPTAADRTASSNAIDTLLLDRAEQVDYTHVYGIMSYGDTTATCITSATVKNLNLTP